MKKLRTILLIAVSLLLLSSCESITDTYVPKKPSEITVADQMKFTAFADTMLVTVTEPSDLKGRIVIGTLDNKILYIEEKADTDSMSFINFIIGFFVGIIFTAFAGLLFLD